MAIARGEWNISGMTNRLLQQHLRHLTSSAISRVLKRMRLHGLIKKIGHRYEYYLTKLGCATLTAALQLRQKLLIPALQPNHTH